MGPTKRSIQKWKPLQKADEKRLDAELRKLKPEDGAAALLGLVKEWRDAGDTGTQDMVDRKALVPLKGPKNTGLWEFRSSVGNKQARLIAALEGDVMYLLHAFSKTKSTDSDHGIQTAQVRWNGWDV